MGDEVEPTLARLEAEIWNQESTKTALLEQLASLESSLAHLRAKYGIIKNRTALIGILPNEILAKIFELGRDLNRPGGDHFEIVVSHVSHLWRQVAIRAPSLWNILEIAPHTSGSLATYLARAKACSLELRFNFIEEIWVPDQSVWDSILPTVDRWRSLVISTGIHDAGLYTTLAHLEPFRASILEEITISIVLNSTTRAVSALSRSHNYPHCFHAGAPMLRTLRLEGSYLSSNWPPLTHLSTLFLHQLRRSTRPSWGKFRDLLRSPLRLSRLSIYGDVVFGKRPQHFEIQMPHLLSLRIRGTALLGNRLSDLLLTISAPYLTSLTLLDTVYTDLDPFLSGFQLFQSLTSLTLYWPNFRANTYLKLFETMPSITRMTVMDRNPEKLLLLLGEQITGSSEFPCAQLVDLALYPGNLPISWIETMINNRSAHAPLPLLRLGDGAPVPNVHVLPFDFAAPWPTWAEYY